MRHDPGREAIDAYINVLLCYNSNFGPHRLLQCFYIRCGLFCIRKPAALFCTK